LIRQANELDIHSITRIYNDLVLNQPTTAQLDAVSLEDRVNWFNAHDRSKFPVFIAEFQGSFSGYLSLSPYRPGRRALDTSAEVSYFVARNAQGMGVGSQLLRHALDVCPSLKIKHVLAILLETNTPSIALLEKFGFQRWGHLPEIAEIQGQPVGQLYYGLAL
jgi:phosphinothricin acetyltransferase